MSGRATGANGYVTTGRMLQRQFTMADIDLLYELDGDPEVMRFLDRKRPSREFIQQTVLPDILRAYDEFPGFGVWAANGPALSWDGSAFALKTSLHVRRPNLGTGCGDSSGASGLRWKVVAP